MMDWTTAAVTPPACEIVTVAVPPDKLTAAVMPLVAVVTLCVLRVTVVPSMLAMMGKLVKIGDQQSVARGPIKSARTERGQIDTAERKANHGLLLASPHGARNRL